VNQTTRRPVAPVAASGQRSLLSTFVVLGLAAAALFVFIAVLADVRRVSNAMRQARDQAEAYALRGQGSSLLPLNLEPKAPAELGPRLIDFEWIPTDEAMALRGCDEPVLAAWSAPILRLFGENGRAVVIFRNGRFDAQWMTETEFLAAAAKQQQVVRRIRG